MFRSHRADHQERQIVSIHPLVAVGGRVVCRSEVKFTSDLHTTQPPTATRGCIDTICLSWWQWRTQEFFFAGGSTNSVEDRGQRGRGFGVDSPL